MIGAAATIGFVNREPRLGLATGPVVGCFFLFVIEARRPSYHGVGWRVIDPSLLDW